MKSFQEAQSWRNRVNIWHEMTASGLDCLLAQPPARLVAQCIPEEDWRKQFAARAGMLALFSPDVAEQKRSRQMRAPLLN